jgi:hypothetical protein
VHQRRWQWQQTDIPRRLTGNAVVAAQRSGTPGQEVICTQRSGNGCTPELNVDAGAQWNGEYIPELEVTVVLIDSLADII